MTGSGRALPSHRNAACPGTPGCRLQALPLIHLRNLGPVSSEMLARAGIRSERQLRQLGAVAAFARVEARGLKPSLNLLYALEGALQDRGWKDVARQRRTDLLLALDDLRRATLEATTQGLPDGPSRSGAPLAARARATRTPQR